MAELILDNFGSWEGRKETFYHSCADYFGVSVVRRTEARKVVHHFFTCLSTALVTLLPSFDSNFSGRFSSAKQCLNVFLSTS